MDPRLVTPYLIAALVVWGFYRRMRRSFGRQRVKDGLMWLRVGILTLAATLIAVQIARDVDLVGILLAGIACGAVLGYLGLRHTKFEVTADGRFYTPHTYIGLAVTALFVGRLAYRFLGMYNGMAPAATAGHDLAAIYRHSPFTLAVIGAVVGYYVLYYLGVLQRTRAPVGRITA
ncbi:MAG TPA: hypothetical protein VGR92_10020 [Steroidobacteraceae bacterium]|nr:hypothetical protein [Steroidobacteraceae bacterium]